MHRLDAGFVAQGLSVPPGTKPDRLASIIPGIWVLIAYGKKIDPWNRYSSLEDGSVIPLIGGIKVHHLPGHSDGMVGLSFTTSDGQRVLFAADAVMHTKGLQKPFVFLDKARGIRSIKKLTNLAADADLMVFGHGDPLPKPHAAMFAFSEKL
jgi:glyoxylase-like metal-dependent hydrolase (beta-lactamase superfamily II)